MTPILIETKTIVCSGCSRTLSATAANCADCAAPPKSSPTARILGALTAFLGSGLLAAGVWLAFALNEIIELIGVFDLKHDFKLTTGQKIFIFAAFGAVAVFGLALLVSGVRRWKTGKRKRQSALATFGLDFALWFLAEIIIFLLVFS